MNRENIPKVGHVQLHIKHYEQDCVVDYLNYMILIAKTGTIYSF